MKKTSIKKITTTPLPTKYGNFKLYLYNETKSGKEHLALVCGNLDKNNNKYIPTRIHSACLTGEVFGSLRCDCQEQLNKSMKILQKNNCGVLIYLNQEGRGIGLTNKIKAYALQDKGLDTAEANEKLGFAADERNFDIAAQILKDLNIKKVKLMTNHPRKIADLEKAGIKVQRKSLWVGCHDYNHDYLIVKREKLGHLS
ncbi:MAG: GTP cyclohydrolase II [Parcubacteria group bacterium]|nr:GTP cyclohydrolase II [Parcubacteria group bacterium]